MQHSPRHGFTLVELSVALVIIALLVGGVLIGRDLIRTAKLRKTVSQYQQFSTAIFAFRNKFRCEPGDCVNAYDFLGDSCGDNSSDPLTGCNGDGDGQIYKFTDGLRGEYVKAWMHLAQAGLISGNYSGRGPLDGSGLVLAVVGVNIPNSLLENIVWNYTYCDDMTSVYTGSLVNSLCLGGAHSTPTIVHNDYAIRLMDALYIDTKLDDGKPLTGKVRGNGDNGSGICDTADYINGNPPETAGCTMTFFQ
jgi:prepilin-type N-terminal cleavage/methylation domain-containing protein